MSTNLTPELRAFLIEHNDSHMTPDEIAERYPYALPTAALVYGNHAAVRRDLALVGSHFYDRDALRFFNARTSDNYMRDGRFWIESKRFESDPRTYQVAWVVTHDGESRSVERLAEVSSLREARKLRDRLAELVSAALAR